MENCETSEHYSPTSIKYLCRACLPAKCAVNIDKHKTLISGVIAVPEYPSPKEDRMSGGLDWKFTYLFWFLKTCAQLYFARSTPL